MENRWGLTPQGDGTKISVLSLWPKRSSLQDSVGDTGVRPSPNFHVDLLLDPRHFLRLVSPSVKKGSALIRSSDSTRLRQSCRGGQRSLALRSQETNGPRTPVPSPLPPVRSPSALPPEGSHRGIAEAQSGDSANAPVALKAAFASRAELCSLLADELLQVKGHPAGSGVSAPWVTRVSNKEAVRTPKGIGCPCPCPACPAPADMHLEAPGERAGRDPRGARGVWDASIVEPRAPSPRL